jgi:toxin ParE1/3/4
MPPYELAAGARDDLKAIAKYSISQCGANQAKEYISDLEISLEAIGRNEVTSRRLFVNRPDILHLRCKRHFIFYQRRENRPPLIIAVLHEKMDLLHRLATRLG